MKAVLAIGATGEQHQSVDIRMFAQPCPSGGHQLLIAATLSANLSGRQRDGRLAPRNQTLVAEFASSHLNSSFGQRLPYVLGLSLQVAGRFSTNLVAHALCGVGCGSDRDLVIADDRLVTLCGRLRSILVGASRSLLQVLPNGLADARLARRELL